MPLIEINPDLKETNKILERLTRVMERLLLEQYGVALGHCAEPATDPNPSEKATVGYHTDEDTLREDLKKLAGYNAPESSDEEFGI